jgi:DNA invertase Pin-like site-specific DNA recombinase
MSSVTLSPVYGYLRVSGKSQLDGDGFPRQRATITKYAAANKLHVARWFEERAVPGKTEWTHREEWKAMLALVPHGTPATILIERLDRLARDLMVQEHIIKDLRERGITLISVHEPDLCIDDPTRKLLRQIMGAIAEYDKTMLVIKLTAGRKATRDKGGHAEGPPRYSEDAQRYPGEAQVVERIRQLVAAGPQTYASMANTLNAEGALTRKGKAWTPMMVWRIVRRIRQRRLRRTPKAKAAA